MIPVWAYDKGKTEKSKEVCDPDLGDLLQQGLSLFPEKVAIADKKQSYSFQRLELFSNQIAAWLKEEYRIESHDPVIILTQKDCLVAAVTISLWKLGAVYVPVDGDSPETRIENIVNSVGAKLCIVFGNLPDLDCCPFVSMDNLIDCISNDWVEQTVQCYRHRPDDVAYIIHTSGSTGEPKGVQITANNLKKYFISHNQVLRYNENSRVFSLSPFHFDVSIEDTILPLSLGAYVFQYNRLHQGAIIRNSLIEQKATHLIAVSTILTLISEQPEHICRENFPDLEMVMTGAEVCAPTVINIWKQALPSTRVINAYGPTEVTIVCTCYTIDKPELDRDTAYPIGKPLQGVEIMILDEEGNEVPDGMSGELCLGGDQVMLGYLNKPEETSKRIFSKNSTRFYRSGDICLKGQDGNIQFVGRNDEEVKVNGRRIHLGEIKQQCLVLEGVEQASVGLVYQERKPMIAAVIVSSESQIIPELNKHLEKVLPVYMRPMIWGVSNTVTLNSSGKTNDKKLLKQLSEKLKLNHQKIVSL